MSGLTPAQMEAKWIGERMLHNIKANERAVKVASDAAWAKFKKRFPGADTSERFRTEASFDENGKAWAGVVFITSDRTKEVFDERGKPLPSVYMTEAMRKALVLELSWRNKKSGSRQPRFSTQTSVTSSHTPKSSSHRGSRQTNGWQVGTCVTGRSS
ncbi:hypothetical protein OS493_001580 [Desmophyllum pertusum]|uniref:Uncharacterized protein n=1 Tax=Desmophyllum pertusum TaxID=174260 RepID=A0A9W9ZK20_9CNID|nr:hypothetical protein OS493_001580 [Desmophyllum pertusum]